MLKKISIMAFAAMTAMSPIASCAASGDDVDDLRADSKRKNEWIQVKKDRLKKITTWAKQEEGKTIRSFKVDMIVDANLETVARVHYDVENIKRWFWETKESRLLKKVSNKEFYYYQVFNAPLTVPDRDSIVHVVVEPFTAKKGYMALKLTAAPEFMPVQPGRTRVQAQDMVIKFTPIDKSTFSINAPIISLKSMPVSDVCCIPSVKSPDNSKLKSDWNDVTSPVIGFLNAVMLV